MFYEQAYPEAMARARKWKEMAERLGIEIEVDPELERRRIQAELDKAAAEFLTD